MMPQDLDELQQNSVLQEYRFESQTWLIGPLIARLRSGWHSIAGKWAIRFLVQQQNAFNLELVAQLQRVEQRIQQAEQQLMADLSDTNESMAMGDRDLVRLAHDVAELTQQVIQLQRIVADLQAHHVASRTKTNE